MEIISNKTHSQGQIINKAISVLEHGGIVIYPTETCYGVAVDATNPDAVKKLLMYKKRPEGKPISVAVANIDMAKKYVQMNEYSLEIYNKFLPGPVTVISKSNLELPKGLASEIGNLGIRIPDFGFVLELITAYKKPITATSANSSGKKTPYSIDDIFDNISQKQKNLIDLVIDYGQLPPNPPSTVIDATSAQLQILRRGSINPGAKVYEKIVRNEDEMQSEGTTFMNQHVELLRTRCLLFLFNADLGAGKTQFTKGIAKSLQIDENVNSPTYSILKEYDFDYKGDFKKLLHFDAWRVETKQQFEELNIMDYVAVGNVIVIEWSGGYIDYFEQLVKDNPSLIQLVEISIEYLDQNKRRLIIEY
jgi:L-threonylcarbamoyladenylate synthase